LGDATRKRNNPICVMSPKEAKEFMGENMVFLPANFGNFKECQDSCAKIQTTVTVTLNVRALLGDMTQIETILYVSHHPGKLRYAWCNVTGVFANKLC
jgi:hypothetical protein